MAIAYYPDLTTREAVERLQGLTGAETNITSGRTLINELIHRVSREAVISLNRVPMPYTATHTYDYGDAGATGMIDRQRLMVDDLLSVTSLTVAGELISANDYVLRPANEYPKFEIRTESGSAAYFTYSTNREDAFSVAGEWGYVPHYPSHLVAASTLDGPVASTTTTSLTLAAAGGIEILDYIRIDDETMQVIALDGVNATVRRGQLGTTAATHIDTSVVYLIEVLGDIQAYVTQLVQNRFQALYQGITPEPQDPELVKTFERHRKFSI